MKNIIKGLILGFLLVITMAFANAVSINQESQTIVEGDSLTFEASGEDIVYYEWDFSNAIPEKIVSGRYIFYTSAVHDGKFGNTEEEALANADKICTNALREAGIPGTCKAILSTANVNAIDRIPESSDGFYNTYGNLVANDKDDLTKIKLVGWDQQLRALIFDEIGNIDDTSSTYIWTGSNGNLEPYYSQGVNGAFSCTSWTSNKNNNGNPSDPLNNGNAGLAGHADYPYPWNRHTKSCDEENHIYGVQDENPLKIYDGTKIRKKIIGDVQFNIPREYPYTITLKGYKADGSYESDSITITVLENQAPIVSVEDQITEEGYKLIFPVIAKDPENEELTFSVETDIEGYEFSKRTCIYQEDIDLINLYYDNPAEYREDLDFNNDGEINILDIMYITDRYGACEGDSNYNAEYDLDKTKNQMFTWQTDYEDSGEYYAKFTVIDARGKSTSEEITITINDVNRLPSKPVLLAPINNAKNLPLNALLTWQESIDPDNDDLTYKVYFGEELELVSTQTQTTFDPELNYETTYYWKIVVSDGKESVKSDVYTFTTVKKNTAPTLSGIPAQSFSEDSGFLNNIIDLWNYANDAETEDSGLSFSISTQSNTGIVSCSIDSNRYIDCSTVANKYGYSDVTVQVSDGSLTASNIFRITITSVNDPPTAQITADSATIIVGGVINFQGQGSDVEDSAAVLSYSWDFDEDNQIDSIEQNPSYTFNTIGTFTVKLTVTDSESASGTDTVVITVTDTSGNHAPIVDTFSPSNTDLLIADNVDLEFSTTSSDFESGIEEKIWYVDDVQEFIGDSFTFNKVVAKTYKVKFEVTDNVGLSDSQTWTIVVSDVPVTSDYSIPSLSGDLTSVSDFYINQESYGKIDFGSEVLNLNDVVDLDNNVIIGNGIIGINTAVYPQLNKPATLTMRGLTFTETPIIYYTDKFTTDKSEVDTICGSDRCSDIIYNNGVLTFKVTGFSTFAVKTASKLTIEDLDIEVGDKTDTNVLNGETLSKEALPGSAVTLKFKIKNTLTDLEIEDIDIKATLIAIDDGEDIEEESREFDLKAGKSKSTSLTLNVPYRVEEGSYDLEIHVEGDDENGDTHEIDWTVKLIVEKNKHEVIIYKTDIGSETLSCVRTTNLNIEILNIGQEEEDVKLVVSSNELGIDFSQGIELTTDYDDESSYEKTIRINAQNLEEGTYPISIKVYRDNILEDSKEVNLIVEECEVTKEEKKEMEIITGKIIPKIKEIKEVEDVGLIITLIGGIVVVLVLIILALYLGFRKR